MMNNLFRIIENIISDSSFNALKLSKFSGGLVGFDGRLMNNLSTLESLHFIATHRDDFDPVIKYKIPNKYSLQYNRILRQGDFNKVIDFLELYAVKVREFDSEAFMSAILMDYFGQYDLSQKILDDIYAKDLRGVFYPYVLERIKNTSYKKKMIENASKPRNKHYCEAIKIAKNTWRKYPAASKNGMCRKLYEYFNGEVSVDSLERWIKSAKLKPKVKSKATSFSLVTG